MDARAAVFPGLFALAPTLLSAEPVEFVPCGFQTLEGDRHPTQEAPNFSVINIESTKVVAIVKGVQPDTELPCTSLLLSTGREQLVVGAFEEVRAKLKREPR